MSRILDFSDGFTSETASSVVPIAAVDVSVSPSGNLASTNVQAALVELQTDVDTRATTAAMIAADTVVLNAAEDYVDVALAALVASAPGTLDTLNELATALGNDPNFATTVSTSLGNRLRVDTAAQGLTAPQKTNAKTNIDLQNVDNTSDATKNAAAATLTNKTLTTPVMDVVSLTDQGSTPASPSAGTHKAYIKSSTGKLTILDSTGVEVEVGTGSGGGVNWISNGSAESSTTGWAVYADAAGTSPVNGTGGSPSVSISTTSSSPLSGSNSFTLVKAGSNYQGQGWSYDFSIDIANKARVQSIKFDYQLLSGTFVAGTSTTDSDVTVWIYDVTNSVLIQPSSYKLLSNSSSLPDSFQAEFQTSSNSTSYRLIFHIGSTSANAYTLLIDSVQVSPNSYVFGSPVSDVIDAGTITFGGTTTPPTKATTREEDSVTYQRVGRYAIITYTYRAASAAGAAAGTGSYLLTLPTGLTADTNETNISATAANASISSESAANVLMHGYIGVNSSSNGPFVLAHMYSSTQIALISQVNMTQANYWGSTLYALTNAATGFRVTVRVPIAGWGSSVQMADQTSTRVVAMYTENRTATGALNSSDNVTIFGTVNSDSHAAYNTTTGVYTVQPPGWYEVSAGIGIVATFSAGNTISVTLYKNGVAGKSTYIRAQTAVGASAYKIELTSLVYVNTNDTLDIRSSSNGTSLSYTGSASSLSFKRISGPSQIASSESIIAKYRSTASQALTASVTNFTYASADIDTHSAFVPGTGIYTCPISGVYRVSAIDYFSAVATMGIYKNGTLTSQLAYGAAVNKIASGAMLVVCNAGDTLSLRSDVSVTRNSAADSNSSQICIERIGNRG